LTVETHTLSNGLRIVTEHMPGLKSAAIGLWVMAGGRHERPEENGIAHFLEHMAFKGTARRSALQIAEEIEDVGGYINAYTGREMTAYYARVLEADVGLALDILADIVMHPSLPAAELEVERGVILQEIGQALDTPDDIIFDWLQEVSYPDQPFGRTILGPTERVNAFARADLAGFIAEHYAPDRLILAAAGAVDHDAIVRQAETLFGGLVVRGRPLILPATFSGGERREVKKLEQAHFTLGFVSPGVRDPGVYAAQIYTAALGGGMSSRLFQELRERRGLCYTIFAQASAYEDTGMITVYAGTGPSQIAELAELTADELRRSAEGLSPAEIDRARAQMKAGLLMGLESPSARCERLARMIAVWNRVPDVEETVARIDAVTPGDIRTFAETLCTGPTPAMALYGPVRKAPDIARLAGRLAA
jgi:predicted Zn-dependent peptidase